MSGQFIQANILRYIKSVNIRRLAKDGKRHAETWSFAG